MDQVGAAPGWPGSPTRWTSSAKSGVGVALGPSSRVWFTLSHGILNEIYYPRADDACTRDFGLIVTDGGTFFSQEKRHTRSSIEYLAEGVPAYRCHNTCTSGRYRIEKDILTDPRRDVVLQRIRFIPLMGSLADYHLYALLAPHLGKRGSDNTAWLDEYKGVPMLFAKRDRLRLALACSVPWRDRSVGFSGVSDGWRDLSEHGRLTQTYTRAEAGNVALLGEIDLMASGGAFVLALGFGRYAGGAAHRAWASLLDGPEVALADYIAEWRDWQETLIPPAPRGSGVRDLYRVSAAVLRSHEAKSLSGAILASLSIPWGFAKGDEDLGGYHLIWTRDLVEAAGGLLAVGAHAEARRVLGYLRATQEANGSWPQNMWIDGSAYWRGSQMDEVALPILLIDLAQREGALEAGDLESFWPMVRRAVGFLVCNGPVTQQDRWEEDPGYSPFTLAAEISALILAADLADRNRESALATYLRETADLWNASIERWTYSVGTALANRLNIEGYYVRIAPPEEAEAASPLQGFVPIKNRPPGQDQLPAFELVSPDALALVRFGLRAADDPRIVATVRAIDELLKVEFPHGPAWRRYNEDGYGEHEDGAPFDGTGIGRPWPLLTGERGHYELAAGRPAEAARLLEAVAAFASPGGMIPEQVWDGPDLPDRELFFGRPSGSAMPLVWAHAEYLKLHRSLRDGRPFDLPPQTVQRYVLERKETRLAAWRFNHKCTSIPAGRLLRIEALAPARIRWGIDGWCDARDVETRDTGLGIHLADLPTGGLPSGSTVEFTFYWPGAERWEGADFRVIVE